MKLFIAATRQNDGKTTSVLGLLNAFIDIFRNVGYIKPMGQKSCTVDGLEVDKDVFLMRNLFSFREDLSLMSPIVVTHGFTKQYLLNGNSSDLKAKILNAYQKLSDNKDMVVIEGTGHAGVGSIFDLSNAAVAELLGAPTIIVTCGGLGKTVDELMLNKAVFDKYHVNVIGVIVNKVLQENYEEIDKFIRIAFGRKDIPVLGVVPFHPMLSNPTIKEVIEETKAKILAGEENLEWTIDKILIGAMSSEEAVQYFYGNVLLITPGSRNDFIIGALSHVAKDGECDYSIRGILLTGGTTPNGSTMKLLKEKRIPVIMVREDTYNSAKIVSHLLVKTRPEDVGKIKAIKWLIEQYVDIDRIIAACKSFEGEPQGNPLKIPSQIQ